LSGVPSSDSNRVYAGAFQGGEAVARYFRKLGNRIDVLRDLQETEILARELHGALFDCTIGVGRFVGRLPLVTSYAGMDLSAEFVGYVRERYPGVQAEVGDLTKRIAQPDARFDSVLCLRSLSAIGHLDTILPEMLRITRPGGVIAFDYGRKERQQLRMRGTQVKIDAEDLEGALRRIDAEILKRVPVDGVLARLKIRLRVFRFLTGRHGRWISDRTLMAAERALAPRFWQREIIFLRKPGPTR
jgi:SAM-dependent methyltransferase